MALIDLKTDLKSLKYGLDRRGLGSSKEPFITKTIPEGDTPGATLDYALRQGALSSAEDDKSRLTKLLLGDDPRGNKFISTTNLLSAQSVKTEATKGSAYAFGAVNQGVYTPATTIAQTLASVGGGHLNLLGLNPLSPLAGVSDSGNLFEIGALNRYEDAVKATNTPDNFSANRLVSLYDTKISGSTILPNNPLVSSDPNFILEYGGGPNSVGGIGRTRTKRATTTKTLTTAYKKLNGDPLTYTTIGPNSIDGNLTSVKTYNANPNFTKYRYGNVSSEGNYAEDKFNKLTTATLNNNLSGSTAPTEQLFDFYMQFIAPPSTSNDLNEKYLSFQAYVDSFNDSIGANYNAYEYVGRGYPLYKYGGFTRKIGLEFTVVAHTPAQIVPIYTKLNNLIQSIAPNYSDGGHMRGNFVRLTFGDYLNNVPGIIEGFSLTPIFEAGFDITNGKQLAKAIQVSGFSFIPIADNNNGIMSSNSTFISYDDAITS